MTEIPLVERLSGRSRFCRDRGEIKTPELLEEAAAMLKAAMEALVNANMALEFWDREAAMLIPLLRERGLNPAMLERCRERGNEERAAFIPFEHVEAK